MQLEYTELEETITKKQKLVDIINTKNQNKEKISRKILADEMEMSIPWIDKTIKQINTEEICIVHGRERYHTNYTNLREKGVYSKIIKMIEVSEIVYPFFIFTNKQLCTIFGVSEKTVFMYREYIKENLPIIIKIWEKNEDRMKEIEELAQQELEKMENPLDKIRQGGV